MSRKKGFAAETRAAEWLKARGFEIIARNFATKHGEIDIIARKKDETLRFIEVKSGETFEPIYAITPAKLAKIIQTAETYLAKTKSKTSYSIDALIARGDNFELIENITI
ncbi:MAG: YraN family protein [Helicobacteraceae bacterium]|jgi:putative endonuclease|nr:YraN family protein [Helicobacteraceae bacterium]